MGRLSPVASAFFELRGALAWEAAVKTGSHAGASLPRLRGLRATATATLRATYVCICIYIYIYV